MDQKIIRKEKINFIKLMITTLKKNSPIQFSIKKIDNLKTVKTTWLSLEERSTSSFFLTWSWMGPWAKLIINVTDLYLFSCKVNEKIVALSFITLSDQKRSYNFVTSKQVHINEYLTADYNMVMQYNDILVEDKYRDIIWIYLLKALDEWEISWDEINVRSVTQDNYKKILKIPSKFKKILYREDITWRVSLTSDIKDFSDLLHKFKSKSRQQLRQSIKACNIQTGKIKWQIAENIDDALKYFLNMGILHEERWAKVNMQGAFANEKWVDFNKDVITEGFSKGEMLLIKISCESTTLGFLYGFMYNSTVYMYQSGFTNTLKNIYRPGYLSHLSAMMYCSDKNIKTYDFLPDSKNSYKRFFADAGEPIHCFRIQRLRLKFILENSLKWLYRSIKSLFS